MSVTMGRDTRAGDETVKRFLVVGTGSIGERHCRNLVALGHVVDAWDADPDRLRAVGGISGVRSAERLEEGLAAGPDAVLIFTPPASHVSLARAALAAGAHVFVEKPVSNTADDVPSLIAEARRQC